MVLCLLLCAPQGWRVDVFERLAPLVDEEGNVQASIGPRSYNILLRWQEGLTVAGEAGWGDVVVLACLLLCTVA